MDFWDTLLKAIGARDVPFQEKISRSYPKKGTDSIPAWLDQLFRSPLMDSLTQLRHDKYPPYLSAQPDENLGTYRMIGALNMNPDKSKYDTSPRNVLIHEMGHGIENNMDFPSDNIKLPGWKEALKSKNDSPDVNKAKDKLDLYYSKGGPSEAYAQAFKNAFNFLGETSRDPKQDYRKLLGDLEANTPGTGTIVQQMMNHPLFKNHPLQSVFNPTKKAP